MNVDCLIIATLADEFRPVRERLHAALAASTSPTSSGIPSQMIVYEGGRHNRYEVFFMASGISVAIASLPGMGQLRSAAGTARILADIRPRLVLLTGIAACMGERNGEFSLGDILVSEQIIDFELEKSRSSKEDIEHRWQHMASDNDLLGRLKASSKLSASVWSGLPDRPDKNGQPTIHFGDVLSGSEVVDNARRKKSLKTQRPLAKGLEMEAAGIALVMTELAMPGRFLMAKAFSDWADGTKDDNWRHYCCESAAAYCAYLVTDVLPAYLQSKEDEVSVDRVLAAQLKRATERRLWPGYGNYRIGSSIGARITKAAAEEINRLGALEHALGETLEQGGSASSDGVYRASIGTGDQFLLRAEPLFSRAAHVIATSLDTVSTFWMNPKKKQHVRNYIKLQGKKSTGRTSASRLFVFRSPASAHRYARRLDFHASHCTGTYLCSLDSYKKLLEQWAPEQIEKYSRRDFAFLTYGSGERPARLFADLDEDSLSVRRSMSVYDGGEVDWEKVQADFYGYALMKPGEVNAASLVMQWDRQIWQDAMTWANRLKQLFVLPKADVRHLIGLDLDLDEATLQPLRHELARIRYSLTDGSHRAESHISHDYDVRDVWVGRRIDRSGTLREPTTSQPLVYRQKDGYRALLAMRLRDEESLADFMQDARNTDMRLSMFRAVSPAAAKLLDAAKVQTSSDLKRLGKAGQTLYRALEKEAAKVMHRMDYVDDELIDQIVLFEPPAF